MHYERMGLQELNGYCNFFNAFIVSKKNLLK